MSTFYKVMLLTMIFFPIMTQGYAYRGHVVECRPNAGTTYVNGTVEDHGKAVNGINVAFSFAPDGPIVASIISGPHPGYPNWDPGFWSHILSTTGPRAGDWYFWLTDNNLVRVSDVVHLHTDALVGDETCQQAVIAFSKN